MTTRSVFSLLLLGTLIIGGMSRCTDNDQPTLDIEFKSIVGSYSGIEAVCLGNPPDTMCVRENNVLYKVSIKTLTTIEIDDVKASMSPTLFTYNKVSPNPDQLYNFSAPKMRVTYYAKENRIELINESTENKIIIYSGKKQ
jgi:hypothetical protein